MKNGYSICFNKWSLDKDIKNELGLLLIISSLCAEKGYCYASNKYLADLFDITETSVSLKIKKLEGKGYIEIEYERRGCEVISREIRIKNFEIDELKKIKSTNKKNLKENNISNNNININNNIYTLVKDVYIPYEDIIKYLNEKANVNYRSTTKKTKDLIKARLNEGFTIEDFKKVIDIKTKEWLGNRDMEKYLRPETLFGTKFESYLNQKEKKSFNELLDEL